ncbi:MAG: hypothetical protein QXE81_03225 [Desulfurococcaceae archaeon]
MYEQIVNALTNVAIQIINAIPAVILALIVILIGYLIGLIAKTAVRFIFDRVIWRFLAKTAIGRKFEEAKVNLGYVLGSIVMAVIIALSILLAINMLGVLGPAVEFIARFINLLIGILGGIVVLLIGIPLAALAGEYLAKLIGLAFGEKEGFTTILQTILTVLFILFVIGLAIAVMFGTRELLEELTAALPRAFSAGVIIIVGYIVGELVSKAIRMVVEKIAAPLEKTDIGGAIKSTGLDTPGLIAGLVKALIIVIAITIGLGMLALTGIAADVLGVVTFYLPRVFGSLVIIILGLPLILIFSKYIGKIFRTALEEKYKLIADLVENIIAIGLAAIFITIALNILILPGEYVYSLIIGTVIIAVGIIVVDKTITVLKDTSPVFARMLPIVGTVFVFIVVYIGISAMLSQIHGTVEVLKTISWGIAAALAIVLVLIMFFFIRIAWREASETRTE